MFSCSFAAPSLLANSRLFLAHALLFEERTTFAGVDPIASFARGSATHSEILHFAAKKSFPKPFFDHESPYSSKRATAEELAEMQKLIEQLSKEKP